jgi:hypothetical protein
MSALDLLYSIPPEIDCLSLRCEDPLLRALTNFHDAAR